MVRLCTAVMVTLEGSYHRDQLCGLVATAILRLGETKDITNNTQHAQPTTVLLECFKHTCMRTLRGLINSQQ